MLDLALHLDLDLIVDLILLFGLTCGVGLCIAGIVMDCKWANQRLEKGDQS